MHFNRYCDILHRASLHLGGWARVEGRSAHAPYNPWSSSVLWPQGALVKHNRELYRAEGITNAAEPGNTTLGWLIGHKFIYAESHWEWINVQFIIPGCSLSPKVAPHIVNFSGNILWSIKASVGAGVGVCLLYTAPPGTSSLTAPVASATGHSTRTLGIICSVILPTQGLHCA